MPGRARAGLADGMFGVNLFRTFTSDDVHYGPLRPEPPQRRPSRNNGAKSTGTL